MSTHIFRRKKFEPLSSLRVWPKIIILEPLSFLTISAVVWRTRTESYHWFDLYTKQISIIIKQTSATVTFTGSHYDLIHAFEVSGCATFDFETGQWVNFGPTKLKNQVKRKSTQNHQFFGFYDRRRPTLTKTRTKRKRTTKTRTKTTKTTGKTTTIITSAR